MSKYRHPWEDNDEQFPLGTPPEDMNFLSLIQYIEDHNILKEPPLSIEEIQEIFSLHKSVVVEDYEDHKDNMTYDDKLYTTALVLCWERACGVVKRIIEGEYMSEEHVFIWNLLRNLIRVGQHALAESLDRQTGCFDATHVICRPFYSFQILEGNTGLGRIFFTHNRRVEKKFWGEYVN